MSDFSIWDGALSAEEVSAIFLSNAAYSSHAQADVATEVLRRAHSSLVHQSVPPSSTTPKLTHSASVHTAETPIKVDDDPIVPILLQRARASLESCESYETRLDLYAEAAERGSAEALYKWALLVKQGSEVSNTACGVDSGGEEKQATGASASGASNAGSSLWGGAVKAKVSSVDHDRATLAMLIAADQGHAPALVSLAFTLLNGRGAEPLLNFKRKYSTEWALPVHPAFAEMDSELGRNVYRQPQLQASIGRYLTDTSTCTGSANNAPFDLSVRVGDVTNSVLMLNTTSDVDNKNAHCADPTALAIGLLQVAAVHRVVEAHQALAHRYTLLHSFFLSLLKVFFSSSGTRMVWA